MCTLGRVSVIVLPLCVDRCVCVCVLMINWTKNLHLSVCLVRDGKLLAFLVIEVVLRRDLAAVVGPTGNICVFAGFDAAWDVHFWSDSSVFQIYLSP